MNWLLSVLPSLFKVLPHRCIWQVKLIPTICLHEGQRLFRAHDICSKCGRDADPRGRLVTYNDGVITAVVAAKDGSLGEKMARVRERYASWGCE